MFNSECSRLSSKSMYLQHLFSVKNHIYISKIPVDITLYTGESSKKDWFQCKANKPTFKNHTIPPIGTASGSFWIGGSDMLVEGEWEWMTSHNLVTFTDWASGEPDDFLNQDCLDIKTSAHYHWNDSPCSYLHWFICEKHVYDF